MQKRSIALVTMATRKYISFVQRLVDSARAHFMRWDVTDYYCLTDSPTVPQGVTRAPLQHLPWPLPTLLRYHAISALAKFIPPGYAPLGTHDYIYWIDSDMAFVGDVGDEVLTPDLTGAVFSRFWKQPPGSLPFENERRSRAYVYPEFRKQYLTGAFQGGTAQHYLKACNEMAMRITLDLKSKILPVWDEESHWNRWCCMDQVPSVVLDPRYCHVENKPCALGAPKIVSIDKTDSHRLAGTAIIDGETMEQTMIDIPDKGATDAAE
jgi:hypothetical protein